MPDPTRQVYGLALAASLAACATGRVAPLEHDRYYVTSAELADTNAASMYEAIRHLRPQFLRTRGLSSVRNSNAMGPAVIVDQTVLGGIQELTDIPLKTSRRPLPRCLGCHHPVWVRLCQRRDRGDDMEGAWTGGTKPVNGAKSRVPSW